MDIFKVISFMQKLISQYSFSQRAVYHKGDHFSCEHLSLLSQFSANKSTHNFSSYFFSPEMYHHPCSKQHMKCINLLCTFFHIGTGPLSFMNEYKSIHLSFSLFFSSLVNHNMISLCSLFW